MSSDRLTLPKVLYSSTNVGLSERPEIAVHLGAAFSEIKEEDKGETRLIQDKLFLELFQLQDRHSRYIGRGSPTGGEPRFILMKMM